MIPFACQTLQNAASHGQIIQLSMDQTDIGDRFAILAISGSKGDRALPLTWTVEKGAANIGWQGQKILLVWQLAWLPEGTQVILSADRFYPKTSLFEWLKKHGWQYRLRLKTNYMAD